MTNNHKSLGDNNDDSSDGCDSDSCKRHGHHQLQVDNENDDEQQKNLIRMKLKSKSSTNIDDDNNYDNLDDQIRSVCSPIIMTNNPPCGIRFQFRFNHQRPQTTTGINYSRQNCSRLKKILMFGHYHQAHNSAEFKSNTLNICDQLMANSNDKDSEMIIQQVGDSISDIESLESLNLHDHQLIDNFISPHRTTKSYSSPTSPKIMISACHVSKIEDENVEPTKSIVRVIKPTALHPTIHYYPPRPSTSVGVHSGLIEPSSFMASTSSSANSSSNYSSAFHQVLSHHQQSSKSNSLSEPSLVIASNPYSNPISLENIEHEGTINHDVKSIGKSHKSIQEPIHMTLEEVRRIAFGSPERRPIMNSSRRKSALVSTSNVGLKSGTSGLQNAKTKIKNFMDTLLNKTTPCISGGNCSNDYSSTNVDTVGQSKNIRMSSPIITNQNRYDNTANPMNHHTRTRRRRHPRTPLETRSGLEFQQQLSSPFIQRALPPVPATLFTDHNNNNSNNIDNDNGSNHITTANNEDHSLRYRSSLQCQISRSQLKSMSEYERQKYLDYVSSIERVKNCGWYWGPISGEMAEKLLEPEPCGSFLVRDSSDEHYIFSLSFKLDEMVRHVRIEQEQGNFSFGSLKKFRSSTIVDFIESAMEHSRSGQFLFFLRLGPELGPIRVQLLYPVSRFKRVQSLQHICRFVILQFVRRDQIHELALPKYLRQYLDTPYYYSEELAKMQPKTESDIDKEKRLLDMKRKLFLQTDYQTLISKMLINRVNLEKKLSIHLPLIDPLDNDNSSDEDVDTKENKSDSIAIIHDDDDDDNHEQQLL